MILGNVHKTGSEKARYNVIKTNGSYLNIEAFFSVLLGKLMVFPSCIFKITYKKHT